MPPKNKTPQLTTAELRKLIRAHNILSKINVPVGTKREGLIKLIEDKGYIVNHVSKNILRNQKKRTEVITLKGAEELTRPKALTEEQKKKKQQTKQKKAGEKAFLKSAIPAPPAVSKPTKGIKVGKPPPKLVMKKEDELRKAKAPFPTIPKNVKGKTIKGSIGGRPAGKKVEVGKLNVGVVKKPEVGVVKKPKKTEKEKEDNRSKVKDQKARYAGLKRVKNVALLRDAIQQFNQQEVGKSLKKELIIKGKNKEELIDKIIANDIDKVINIAIPPPRQPAVAPTAEAREATRQAGVAQRLTEKPFKPLRRMIAPLYVKYNKILKANDYKDIKKILEDMKNEFDKKFEEIEEKADEDDIELDDEVYESIEGQLDQYKQLLKDISERGLKGEFTAEFKKEERDRLKSIRDTR